LLDIRDAKAKWTITATPSAGTNPGYTVSAVYKNSSPEIAVYYSYAQGEGGTFSDVVPPTP
jgi:hypothetical protein